jgi:hypothetical protein
VISRRQQTTTAGDRVPAEHAEQRDTDRPTTDAALPNSQRVTRVIRDIDALGTYLVGVAIGITALAAI